MPTNCQIPKKTASETSGSTIFPSRVFAYDPARRRRAPKAVIRCERLGAGTCAVTEPDLSAAKQASSRDSPVPSHRTPRTYPGYGCVSSGYWIRSTAPRELPRDSGSGGGVVQTASVEFFSHGERISALWRTPETASGPLRAIVQGPGWLGLKDAKLYVRYHEALCEAGFGVLVIDYRGFGDSDGVKELSPRVQLEDLVSAVTYLTTRDDVDADAIGVFGTGGTGGGNAILLAAADGRVRAAVSQVPVADGEDWLHRMRSESDWLAFLGSLEADRKERVITGKGRRVHPREEIMVPAAERRTTTIKADVDDKIPSDVSLAAADEIIAYKPIDAARGLETPLLVIGIEGD